jgi:MFS family permease
VGRPHPALPVPATLTIRPAATSTQLPHRESRLAVNHLTPFLLSSLLTRPAGGQRSFASRFMFVLAYAFLTTYQAYYLLDKIGTAKAEVPQQIFLGTLTQSAVIVAASLLGGRLSDRTGRRKIFVLAASIVYGLALFVIAIAGHFSGFLVGMAISGLGFGVYAAVDLALVVDVLPDKRNAAKDLGVFNVAGALPFSIAPAIAPAILAIGHGGGSYGVLYMVAGLCAIIGAVAILPVRRVR